jgi:glycosyltransferase involved in cell wall biosynthesis
LFDREKDGLSYIIAAYNEENILHDCLEKCYSALSQQFARFELILVDDGSHDGSLAVMKEFACLHDNAVLLPNYINLNFGASILRGMMAAKYSYIAYNASDLPLEPERTLELLDRMGDADVLVLDRQGYKPRLWRRLTSSVNKILIKMFFPGLTRGMESFNFIQFYKADILPRILPLARSPIFAFAEMIIRAKHIGLQVVNLPFPCVLTDRKGSFGKPHDILWGIYEMLRFRIRKWNNTI